MEFLILISSKRILLSLSALFLGISFIFIADGLIVSSAGLLLKNMNASNAMNGIISSFFFVGAITCTMVSHRLICSVGHVRAYAIFTAAFGISAILHSFSENLFIWMILRFMLGFFYYSIVIVVESWLNAKSKNATRSRVLAFYEIVFYASFGIGAIIMSFNLDSAQVFMIGTFFIILGSIPLNFLKIKAPPIPQKTKISLPKIYEIAPLALVTSISAGLLMNGFFSMATLYVLSLNYTAGEAGIFIISAMCGGFLSHTFFGSFSDKFGRKNSILLASIISFVSTIIFIILKPTIQIQYIMIFMVGVGIFVLYALALARANDVIADKSKCVEVNRALLFSYLIGSFLAPIIIGFLMQKFGSDGFLYFYACILLALIVFTIFQKTVPKEKRQDFEIYSWHSIALKDDNN